MLIIIYTYLFVVNTVTFTLYALDKRRACMGARRIPNAVLLSAAWIGGAYGALTGMLLFRHKTRSTPYLVNVPLALVVWLALLVILLIF